MTVAADTVPDYGFDLRSRLPADEISKFGSSIDQAIDGIATACDETRGLVATIPSLTGATIVNQVSFDHDDFGQKIANKQRHHGTIDGTTPEVAYAHTNPS